MALPTKRKTPEELEALRNQHGGPAVPFSAVFGKAAAENPVAAAPVQAIIKAASIATLSVEKPELLIPQAKRKVYNPSIEKAHPKSHSPKITSSDMYFRHSARELESLRRKDIFTQRESPLVQIQSITAHPILLGIGYLFAISPAIAYWCRVPWWAALIGSIGSFLLLSFLCFFKKRSTHHALLIFCILLLVSAFTAIHYFPNFLRHAS